MSPQERANRTGMVLTLILAGLIVYSFVVIKTRGRTPEPTNITRVQKILRGL